MHMDVPGMTMTALARLLSNVAGRPVIDNTGLTGTYQFRLELSLVDIAGARRAGSGGTGLSGLSGLGGPATSGTASPLAASDPEGGFLFEAVQKLGLRLESTRAPMNVVVIDRMDREPTPN